MDSKFDLGIVMEFKYAKGEDDLDKQAQKALEQINQKHYDALLKTYPAVKRIVKLGLAFNQKQVKVAHSV